MTRTPTHMSRTVAVRKLLVDNLAGVGPNAEFMRVVPALLAQLTPHLRPDPVVVAPLADREPLTPSRHAPLTGREIEILGLLAAGLTNAGIGRRLGVTENTIKTQLRRLHVKLGVATRAEAVAVAMRRGVIA